MIHKRSALVNGEYYHIYNRGVAKQKTFHTTSDYQHALLAVEYYHFQKPPCKLSTLRKLSFKKQRDLLFDLTKESKKHIEIISFSLMPNHFHFLVKQVSDKGISTFVSKFTNSYTKYINTKNNRVGPMFQGTFKAVHVETTEQLLHTSRYIHINSVVAGIHTNEELLQSPYSSFSTYMSDKPTFIFKEAVLEHFPSNEAYKDFVFDQVAYGKTLEDIKHIIPEEDD